MTDTKNFNPTFEIRYSNPDGEYTTSDFVRPVPFLSPEDGGGLAQLIDFQEQLIKIAVFEVAVISELLCKTEAMAILRKMAAIMPVVGRSTKGIDLDNLLAAGDYVQIARIFFSEGYDGQNYIPEDFKPSSIARINQLNFTGKLGEQIIQRTEQREAEAKAPLTAKIEPPKPALLEIPQPAAIVK